ncbi:hypothetical protein [cyanobacterium endosymbiont of Rhopalodia gibberula]|uniref:hypothetical protein n=1 Tax=cyanobacterium endosymbiont of Rhopalodia gibberula TaxID=1763363 RepID=UPI000E64F48F|nr:hypothetical protein [cyanobacterium endosymbiont of Rhopalodia gibberula]
MIRIFGIARLIREAENCSEGERYISSFAHIAAKSTYDNYLYRAPSILVAILLYEIIGRGISSSELPRSLMLTYLN